MRIACEVPGRSEPHAVIREDDTHGVLAADPVGKPVDAPWPAVEAAVRRDRGRTPGTADVLSGRPMRIHAVIHALDDEPTWRHEWLVAATMASFTAAHQRGLTRLAMPLLGTVHGRASIGQAVAALASALDQAGAARPRELLLEGVPASTATALSRRMSAPGDA